MGKEQPQPWYCAITIRKKSVHLFSDLMPAVILYIKSQSHDAGWCSMAQQTGKYHPFLHHVSPLSPQTQCSHAVIMKLSMQREN